MSRSGSLISRLLRLDTAVPVGCPVCRSWDGRSYSIRRVDEPEALPPGDRTCPACGRVVVALMHREAVIVSDELLEATA